MIERKVQYAALPYRVDGEGGLEILLVTSRRSRRWIIPKGWPVKGLRPCDAAAKEAFEEAGVVGTIDDAELGRFSYLKLLEKAHRTVECEVVVFPLHVERQLASWPEAAQRESRWVSANEAATTVSDSGVGPLIHRVARRLAS